VKWVVVEALWFNCITLTLDDDDDDGDAVLRWNINAVMDRRLDGSGLLSTVVLRVRMKSLMTQYS